MIPLWFRTIGRILPTSVTWPIKKRVRSIASRRFHGTPHTAHRLSIDNGTATLGIADVSVVLPPPERLALQKSAWLVTHPEDVIELEVLLKLAKQADGVMFDVGAETGMLAAFFCKASNQNAVCFEPVPQSRKLIKVTAKLNGLGDRIEIVPSALGDKVGVLSLHYDKATGFAHAQNYESSSVSATANIAAQVTTIDAVRASAKAKLAILKIDVEGMEGEVLRGAVNTLRRERPVVLLELHHNYLAARGINLERVLSGVVDHGYVLMRLNGRVVSSWSAAKTILSRVHVLAVPGERCAHYRDLLCSNPVFRPRLITR